MREYEICVACRCYDCDGDCPEMDDWEEEQREKEAYEDERDAWLRRGREEGFC